MPRDVSVPRLLLVGLAAAVLAAAANALVRVVAIALFDIPPEFAPLDPGRPVLYTLVGGVGATLVLVLLSRSSEHPADRFVRIAVVVLLLSFIPDLWLLVASDTFPGTTPAAVATLMLMHVVAAVIIVGVILWGVASGNPLRRHRAQAGPSGR